LDESSQFSPARALLPIVVNVGWFVRASLSHSTLDAASATASWQPAVSVQHQMSRMSELG
jgi:hypothetical protein